MHDPSDDGDVGIEDLPVALRALFLAFLTVPPLICLAVVAFGGDAKMAANAAIGGSLLLFVIPLVAGYVFLVWRLGASIVGVIRKAIADRCYRESSIGMAQWAKDAFAADVRTAMAKGMTFEEALGYAEDRARGVDRQRSATADSAGP